MISYNHESFEGFPRTNNKSRWQYDGHDGPYTVTSLLPFTRVLSQLQVNRERQGIAWGFPGSVLTKISLRVKQILLPSQSPLIWQSRLVHNLLKRPLFARPLGQFLLPAIPNWLISMAASHEPCSSSQVAEILPCKQWDKDTLPSAGNQKHRDWKDG